MSSVTSNSTIGNVSTLSTPHSTVKLPLTQTLEKTNEVAKTPRSSVTASTSKSKLPLFDKLNDFVVSLSKMSKKAIGAIKSSIQNPSSNKKSQINQEKKEVNSSQMLVFGSNTRRVSLLIETWNSELDKLRHPPKERAELYKNPSAIAAGYVKKLENFLTNPNFDLLPAEIHQTRIVKDKFEEIANSGHLANADSATPAVALPKNALTGSPVSLANLQNASIIQKAEVNSQFTVDNLSFSITIGKTLGEGGDGVVNAVEINEEKKAMKRSKTTDDTYTQIEATNFKNIAACKDGQKYQKGLPPPPQIGKVSDRMAIMMELFDEDLEIKSTAYKKSPTIFKQIMGEALSGLNTMKERGYSWGDPRPNNIARKGERYYIFDFGNSKKLDGDMSRGGVAKTYASNNDILKGINNNDIEYFQSLINDPESCKKKLKDLQNLSKSGKLTSSDQSKLKMYYQILGTNNIHSVNPQNLSLALKNQLAVWKLQANELQHKRDQLGLGISFYEILMQKSSALEDNDHYNDQLKIPRYDVIINDLMNYNNSNALDENYLNAIIAMVDPDWRQRPAVEEIENFMKDPTSQPNIQKRVDELKQLTRDFTTANTKYEGTQNNDNLKSLQNIEKQLFGQALIRENNIVKTKAENLYKN